MWIKPFGRPQPNCEEVHTQLNNTNVPGADSMGVALSKQLSIAFNNLLINFLFDS